MARAEQALTALKYQVKQFAGYLNSTYSTSAPDIDSNRTYHIEPFEETDIASYSPLLGSSNYSFVITDFETSRTPDYPSGYLREQFTARIIVARKSLRTMDRTNDRNLIQFGGVTDANTTITSIERICTDMQKWFRNITQGGKLSDGTTERAFVCDITEISRLANTGEFYYKVCNFEALSMESTTISAT